MIDATKTIERAKIKLGAPIIDIELTDEQMTYLLKDAHETFYLYAMLSDISKSKQDSIEDAWTKKYFYALCKETLGRIRGKFVNGITISGLENIKLDSESLLQESIREKNLLKYMIFGDKEFLKNSDIQNAVLVFYINTGNMGGEDVEILMKDIRDKIGKIPGFRIFLLPIKGESRVECIYPVSEELDENGKNVINRLSEYLDELIGKDTLVGKKITLDLGGIGPAQLTIVEIEETLNFVSLKYDSGKIIDFTISEFENLSGIKINKNEQ